MNNIKLSFSLQYNLVLQPKSIKQIIKNWITKPIKIRYFCSCKFAGKNVLFFLSISHEQQRFSVSDDMQCFIDIVAGHPKYNIKKKHCSSNNSQKPIKLFIIAIWHNRIFWFSQSSLNSILSSCEWSKEICQMHLSQPY